MNDTLSAGGKAPAHLWILGILSLLWNCYGAYDYVMSHTGGLAYFESVGLDAAAYQWFQTLPVWWTGAWALGVWGSVLGSLLLLFRSRHAPTAFLISILGAIVSFVLQFADADRPPSMNGGLAAIMPLVIVILIVAQWYYARRMTAAGVLR